MISPLTHEGIQLRYSPRVIAEIDSVIDHNLGNLNLLALFISRLLKGLQNLTNDDIVVDSSWGNHAYEIDDIGMVSFKVIIDSSSGVKYIVIESIQWAFLTSRFFNEFDY